MDLRGLGFDGAFEDEARRLLTPDLSVARVTAVDRDRYLVRDAAGEAPAELTGRYLHDAADTADRPCVGDWVGVRFLDGRTHATIHRLLPRRSFLRRRTPGRDVGFQMMAANVDLAFVTQSCQFDFYLRRLERYLVMAREGRVEPVVLLTKTDLVGRDALEGMIARIRRAGIEARIVAMSNVTGDGLQEIRDLVRPGRTSCFLGSSGVGKTTLINQLAGGTALKTQVVSLTGEGRHTTTRRQLIVLGGGGLLVDLPGLRELGMLDVHEGLDEVFADVGQLAASCRFADCRHASEPGCAVRAAIEKGEIDEEHLRSCLKLRREAAFNDLSYVERRRKDREFGRLTRAVLKEKSRRTGD